MVLVKERVPEIVVVRPPRHWQRRRRGHTGEVQPLVKRRAPLLSLRGRAIALAATTAAAAAVAAAVAVVVRRGGGRVGGQQAPLPGPACLLLRLPPLS